MTLILVQIVTTIPTKRIPKNFSFGSGEVQDSDNILGDEYDDNETHEKRSGQILWIRGLTRLQTQVGHFKFKNFIFENFFMF